MVVGEEAAGAQAIRAVARSRHTLVVVLTSGGEPGGKGSTTLTAARSLGVPVWPAARVRDPSLADQARAAGVDVLLNVHSLHVVVPDVLSAPSVGSFNLHPGPLPEYAGLNVVSWALFRGAREFGVTLHWMEPTIDSGPVAYRADFPIEDGETAIGLMGKCVQHGMPLVDQLLRQLTDDPGAIPAIAQDLSRREYFGRTVPGQGRISWADPARTIVGLVRACTYAPFASPWGEATTTLGTKVLSVLAVERTQEPCGTPSGRIGPLRDGGVWVAGGDEWVVVKRVRLDGRVVPPGEVLRSGHLLGM